jgi:crossover junction endodeoxyribonuclease RusA
VIVASSPVRTNQLTFVVYGHPAPQGSKRHVGNGVMVESSKKVGPWREDVKLAALRALDGNPTWDRTCRIVTAHIYFVLPRPRSHYRTGKRSHELRDDAPHLHTKKPDLDKLIRSTGDALTSAGVYPDDCCLAWINAMKVYATTGGELDRPGAWITLWTGVDE